MPGLDMCITAGAGSCCAKLSWTSPRSVDNSAIDILLLSESQIALFYDELETDEGWIFNEISEGGGTGNAGVENGQMSLSWSARNIATTDILGLPRESIYMEATLPINSAMPQPVDNLTWEFSIVSSSNLIEPFFGPSGTYSISYGGIKLFCCPLDPSFTEPYPLSYRVRYSRKSDTVEFYLNDKLTVFNSSGWVDKDYHGLPQFRVSGGLGHPFSGANADAGTAVVGHIYLETSIED